LVDIFSQIVWIWCKPGGKLNYLPQNIVQYYVEHLLLLLIFCNTYFQICSFSGNREQGTGNREQGTGNREQGTGTRDQGTGNREQGTGNREQGTGNREQGTGNREQGTGNREQEKACEIQIKQSFLNHEGEERKNYLLPLASCLLPSSCHLSPVTCHLSPVTCHLSIGKTTC
jgi:hypothetical protein